MTASRAQEVAQTLTDRWRQQKKDPRREVATAFPEEFRFHLGWSHIQLKDGSILHVERTTKHVTVGYGRDW